MIGDGDFGSAALVPGAAQGGEGLFHAEHVGGGGTAEGDDDLGTDDVDLFEEEGAAGAGFDGLGGAIGGRAALYDVGDVDLFALEAHGGNHIVKELAGLADEGEAGGVFVGTGAFADEHEAGVGVAVAEDDVAAAGVGERAASAVADEVADGLEGGGFLIGGDAVLRDGHQLVEGFWLGNGDLQEAGAGLQRCGLCCEMRAG